MLDRAVRGVDIVFARNQQKPAQSLVYKWSSAIFNCFYTWLNEAPIFRETGYRVFNKSIINFILQHPQPVLTYHYLPAMGGFSRVELGYNAKPKRLKTKRLRESVERGISLLVSTTKVPMRLVTSLCLFAAAANLVYSIYVVVVGFLKADVAPGWVSLSLQQSGMFFLISLVLLVLGEYILQASSLANEGPLYYVGQEFTSTRITRREKLNIEEMKAATMNVSIAKPE